MREKIELVELKIELKMNWAELLSLKHVAPPLREAVVVGKKLPD